MPQFVNFLGSLVARLFHVVSVNNSAACNFDCQDSMTVIDCFYILSLKIYVLSQSGSGACVDFGVLVNFLFEKHFQTVHYVSTAICRA